MNKEFSNEINNYIKFMHDFIDVFEQGNFQNQFDKFYSFSMNRMQHLQGESKRLFFGDLISKVPNFFELLLDYKSFEMEIKGKKLEYAYQVLEVLQHCIENINNESFETMYDVPTASLTVLKISYSHCKDSEIIYGDMLEELSDQLGNFFKQMQNVQLVLVSFLGEMLPTVTTEEENRSLSCICKELVNLCEIVSDLDVKNSAALWKSYMKLIISYKDFLNGHESIGKSVKFLTSSIIEILKELKLNLGESDNQVSSTEKIKIVSFYLKIIIRMCKASIGHFPKNYSSLLDLTIAFYHVVVACFSLGLAESDDVNCLRSFLLINIKPFTLSFMENPLFIASMDIPTMDSVSSDHFVSLCLCLLDILTYLPKHTDLHCHGEKGIFLFKQIFSILNKIEDDIISIKIPLRKSEEDFKLLTMFDYVEIQMCFYISKFCGCYFNDLEVALLDILTTGPDISSFLITKIWCHFVKCCSSSLCYSHCTALVDLYFRVHNTFWVQLLLSQLFNLLPLNEKNTFLRECYSNLKIVYPECLLFHNEDNMPPVIKEEDNVCLATYSDDPTIILNRIRAIENLIVASGNDQFEKNLPNLIIIACCLLRISSTLVEMLHGPKLLQVLNLACQLWTSEVYDVQIAVIEFLKSFQSKFIKPCDESEELFQKLTCLFAKALCCEDQLLQQDAFDAYYRLALSSPHKKILKQVLQNVPHMIQDVKTYIKTKSNKDASEEEIKIKSIENVMTTLKRKPSFPVNYGEKAQVLKMLLPQKLEEI